jgi:hypothetical protein
VDIFSSKDHETFLQDPISDSNFVSWALHHAVARHEVEHLLFQLWLQGLRIYLIKEDF